MFNDSLVYKNIANKCPIIVWNVNDSVIEIMWKTYSIRKLVFFSIEPILLSFENI